MPFSQKLNQIKASIQNEYSLHPEAQLRDYFKYFAQSAFGPGHLIKDLKSTRDNLLSELESSDSFDKVMLQKCDYYYPYYRVNLQLIRDKIIDFDDYFNAFIESSACIIPISEYVFKEEWTYISNVLKYEDIIKCGLEEDSLLIESLLQHNRFLCSHSNNYREKYKPHYRLIHKLFLPENLKPTID